MDEDINFCPHCGKNLPEGSPYCPACGARLNDPGADTRDKAVIDGKNEGRLKIGIAVMVIFSAISLISGIYIYFNAADFVRMMFDSLDVLSDFYTEDAFISLMELTGLLSIMSGAVGLASAVLAWMRRLWLVVIILCLVTVFTGSIFCLIAAYLFYKAKPIFKD